MSVLSTTFNVTVATLLGRMPHRAARVRSTTPWAARWLIAAAAAAASMAAPAAERPIAATELLSASWLRVAREPQLLREDGAEIVRFDERHDPGVLWSPSLAMQDGDIDVDVRGRDLPQKSFVGIACRIGADGAAQVIWLRPFNFRNVDPVRRSHSLQFASHPDYPWDRLRREHPGVFETALTPSPDPSGWVHMHVELRGRSLSIFIDGSPRPALVVETPEPARPGGIGLWVGNDSNGDFKNLRVLRLD
jgi:hypothetical protein